MFQDLGLEVDYDGTDADLEELPNAEFQAMEEAEDVSTGDVPLVTFTPDEDKRSATYQLLLRLHIIDRLIFSILKNWLLA